MALSRIRNFCIIAHIDHGKSTLADRYAQAEAFYDTRYHGWARSLYQGGVEIALNARFRVELYLARQNDRLPKAETLDALGVVGKWYY